MKILGIVKNCFIMSGSKRSGFFLFFFSSDQVLFCEQLEEYFVLFFLDTNSSFYHMFGLFIVITGFRPSHWPI